MASMVESLFVTAYSPLTAASTETSAGSRQVYEKNRHRIYSLCFWMTDNELLAEELATRVFRRAFSRDRMPGQEAIDYALIAELRRTISLGSLTLSSGTVSEVVSEVVNVRSNIRRMDLERAVVQLPPTERLVFLLHDVEQYDHTRIARYLRLSARQSESALHQARLRIRELLAVLSHS